MTVAQIDYRGQAQQKLKEAREVLERPDFSAADMEQVKGLRLEAAQLNERAAVLEGISKEAALMNVPPQQAEPEAVLSSTGFESAGEFYGALAKERKYGQRDERLSYFADGSDERAGRSNGQKDLSSAVGGSGGYLIPTEFYDQMMSVAAPLTAVRSRATVIPMGSRSIQIPVLDQEGATAGVPSFFGGVTVYWAAEAAQAQQTQPAFRMRTLTAHKMMAYTPIPEELLEDADTSLTAFLNGPMGFPGAMAWKEDYSFLRGTGVGQPQGVIDAPCTIATTRAGANAITYDDLVNMDANFMGNSPVWLATWKAKAELQLMNGPSGNPVYLWGDAASGKPNTLLGYPIQFVDKLPAVGVKGDILLADFSYYLIGDRKATTVRFSEDYLFRTAETAALAVHRVDGQPWLNAPITLTGVGASVTVSPFVTLAA